MAMGMEFEASRWWPLVPRSLGVLHEAQDAPRVCEGGDYQSHFPRITCVPSSAGNRPFVWPCVWVTVICIVDSEDKPIVHHGKEVYQQPLAIFFSGLKTLKRTLRWSHYLANASSAYALHWSFM